MYKSSPILSPGIWRTEEPVLEFRPISDSARKSKERTEKQNTGSIMPQRTLHGIAIQTQGDNLMYYSEGRLEASKGATLTPSEWQENHLVRIKKGKSLRRKRWQSCLETALHSSLTFQVYILEAPFKVTETPEYVLESHGLSIKICIKPQNCLNRVLYLLFVLASKTF